VLHDRVQVVDAEQQVAAQSRMFGKITPLASRSFWDRR
jgi:hypothetical protein